MGQHDHQYLAQQSGMMIPPIPTPLKRTRDNGAWKHPVGTGPFEFLSREKDVKVTYKNLLTTGKKENVIWIK